MKRFFASLLVVIAGIWMFSYGAVGGLDEGTPSTNWVFFGTFITGFVFIVVGIANITRE